MIVANLSITNHRNIEIIFETCSKSARSQKNTYNLNKVSITDTRTIYLTSFWSFYPLDISRKLNGHFKTFRGHSGCLMYVYDLRPLSMGVTSSGEFSHIVHLLLTWSILFVFYVSARCERAKSILLMVHFFIHRGLQFKISIKKAYVHRLTHLSPYPHMDQGIQEWTNGQPLKIFTWSILEYLDPYDQICLMLFCSILVHFVSLVFFYTPRKQKTRDFLMFSGCIER